MSTILAVSVLSDVPAYMIVTFFKTVFLAISIGFLHGLVFLPLMLSIFVGKFLEKKFFFQKINIPGCFSSPKIEDKRPTRQSEFIGKM